VSGEKVKPYLCTVCGASDSHKSSLRRHLKKNPDPDHASLFERFFSQHETQKVLTREKTPPSLEDRVAKLEEAIKSKPSTGEIRSMMDSLQAGILKAIDARFAELSAAKGVEAGAEAEKTAGEEAGEVAEETVGAMKRIFGRDVSPTELGTFMQGLGTLITAIRGPPSGPSPFEEAGRAMFTEWTKTMTRVIARHTAEHVAHEATHGEG